jgi:uncharacterized protein (DUF3820 family)
MNSCGHLEIKNVEKLQIFKNGTKHLRLECGECGKFLGYKQQPLNNNSILHFGKYKGSSIKEIPRSYLEWLTQSDWIKNNLKEAIIKYLNEY